jgi:alanine racemase
MNNAAFTKERSWIELSRKNLRHNLEVFRRLCGKATPIWTIKANAYGHGSSLIAGEISKTIGVRGEWFGVDSLDEAIELRAAGIASPIIVLGWVPYPRLKELAKHDLRLLVSSEKTIAELRRRRLKLRLHLKIDTGATRQGILPQDALGLAKRIRAAGLILEGCATHFANIEDVDNPAYADMQTERFIATIGTLKAAGFALPIVHATCSAAAMIRPETAFTACRIGIGLYGLNPSPLVAKRFAGPRLKPVLSWRARIALVKRIPAGTPVGYGLTEKTSRPTDIAIVPVGYSDGYDRGLSSKGMVLVGGKRCRVIGRVCMNMIIVDATTARGAAENDVVTLIGQGGRATVTADELAASAGTINYEIVSRLARHLPRFVTEYD